MLDEYDFSRGRRDKYFSRYAKGSNVAVPGPDDVKVFKIQNQSTMLQGDQQM